MDEVTRSFLIQHEKDGKISKHSHPPFGDMGEQTYTIDYNHPTDALKSFMKVFQLVLIGCLVNKGVKIDADSKWFTYILAFTYVLYPILITFLHMTVLLTTCTQN